MGFQDDWIMRQIEMVAKFVAKVVFKKESEVIYEISGDVQNEEELTSIDQLHLVLCRMIREGKISEAEDMLFDCLEYSDKYILLSTDFYQRLNRLSDEELELGGFSREEVFDGYIDIMTLLGVPVDIFNLNGQDGPRQY